MFSSCFLTDGFLIESVQMINSAGVFRKWLILNSQPTTDKDNLMVMEVVYRCFDVKSHRTEWVHRVKSINLFTEGQGGGGASEGERCRPFPVSHRGKRHSGTQSGADALELFCSLLFVATPGPAVTDHRSPTNLKHRAHSVTLSFHCFKEQKCENASQH